MKGKFQRKLRQENFFSDMNREEMQEALEKRLSLAPTAKEALYTQKFYLYLNLTKPSERVYLSYSRLSSSGEALSPSFLISQMRVCFQTQEKGDRRFFTGKVFPGLWKNCPGETAPEPEGIPCF